MNWTIIVTNHPHVADQHYGNAMTRFNACRRTAYLNGKPVRFLAPEKFPKNAYGVRWDNVIFFRCVPTIEQKEWVIINGG